MMAVLEEQVDEAMKTMICHLIDKKLKYDHYKSTHFFLLSIFILYTVTMLFLCYTLVIIPNNFSMINSLTQLLGSRYLIFLFLAGVFLFGVLKYYFDKKEKAEAEFHDLRCELIEKSQEMWRKEQWGNRHKVFDQLKQKYDINMYYESK
ncbi:DUF2663 family protein [Siminovitchia sediminis]|uniref:DUF2663 family protein n=1 Tax=Siminovitchia sediminis TaxID=1274353 RepID=A0ABW4KK00_9BACI